MSTPQRLWSVLNAYQHSRAEERKKVTVHRFQYCPIVRSSPLKHSGMDHTVFPLQTHHTCLHLVSVHQTAPPLTSDSSHLIAAYYSCKLFTIDASSIHQATAHCHSVSGPVTYHLQVTGSETEWHWQWQWVVAWCGEDMCVCSRMDSMDNEWITVHDMLAHSREWKL